MEVVLRTHNEVQGFVRVRDTSSNCLGLSSDISTLYVYVNWVK